MGQMAHFKEMWDFLKLRKKWWLFPIILFLVLLSSLIVCVFNSSIAPILYPLF